MADDSEILRMLKIIMKLTAANSVKGMEVRSQVLYLHNMGIGKYDISVILNKTQNHVNSVVSKSKRKIQR